VPSYADALADGPSFDSRAERIDSADDLVPRHPRQRHAGKGGRLGQHIAMTDPARIDGDANAIRPRLGNVTLNKLERTIGNRYLGDTHARGAPFLLLTVSFEQA